MSGSSGDHVPAGGRFVGHSVPRREDARLLTGTGRYVDDVRVRGALHAAFVRSDVARARVTGLDVEAARALPGVRHVLTAADLDPHLAGTMLPSIYADGALGKVAPLRPLADGDVRFVGDPVALVLADDRYVAEDAAELVVVGYETLPAVVDYEGAEATSERVHPEESSNVVSRSEVPAGPGLADLLTTAPHVVTETFRQHRYAPVPMEARGIVAAWDRHDGRLDVWISSQNPHEVRRACGRVTGVPEARIRVQIGDVGGGFGQKSFAGREELTVVLAAHLLGVTVKWIEDRRENLVAGSHARIGRITATLALDDDGRFLGAHVDHLEDVGSYQIGGGAADAYVPMLYPGPYRIPEVAWRTTTVWTNTCGRAAYRAPWMLETTAREQMVDAAARALGVDPLDLRRRNVLHRSELPHTHATGIVVDHVSPEETLEEAAAAIGYDAFRAGQAAARAAGRLPGIGLALYVEPQTNIFAYGNEPVQLRVDPDGRVAAHLASGAHGQGLETTTAQLVAEYLGVDIGDVTVHQGDTSSTPYGAGTGGSRSGPMLGAAVIQAAAALRERIFAIAGHLLEAAPTDLLLDGGIVSVRGTPGARVPLAAVAAAAYHTPGALPPDVEPGLEVLERYVAPPTMWSNACHACTVEVDPVTGVVRILRYVVAEDCGQMINPAIVEGQIAGGVAQGLGGALYEHLPYDDDGNPLATTFLDYLVPTVHEVPTIEYRHLETPASTPGALKGVGEGGAIGAPAALANAVNDALAPLGIAVTSQPLDPATLEAAMARAAAPG